MLRRFLNRLGLAHGSNEREWTLRTEPSRPIGASYRHADLPSVGDLIDRLHRHGYQLTACRSAAAGSVGSPTDLRRSLVGVGFVLRDARLPGAGVWLRIGSPTEAGESIGFVVARDASGHGNEELALFIISALGELLPKVRYKDLRSALSFDRTELLRKSLPDRPRAIPRAL